MDRKITDRVAYTIRNWRYKQLFDMLQRYCGGKVLDVGGWDFFLTAKQKGIKFTRWVNIEPNPDNLPDIHDKAYTSVVGNGSDTDFSNAEFDTVINLHVLEHVMDPEKMVKEIARVLKPGGHAVFLIPQTSLLHHLPGHYYNFTRYWIESVMPKAGMTIVEHKALGGFWTTTASHMVYFYFKAVRAEGYSSSFYKRKLLFYPLLPLMFVFALMVLIFSLIFSLADLTEDPNNHLVVVRKN